MLSIKQEYYPVFIHEIFSTWIGIAMNCVLFATFFRQHCDILNVIQQSKTELV